MPAENWRDILPEYDGFYERRLQRGLGLPLRMNAADVHVVVPEGSITPDLLDPQKHRLAIAFIIDGGGSAITTGEKGHLEIPFDCEIKKVTTLADQSGSIVVDIWKDTYANFPPTNADTITGGSEPTLSTAQKAQDDTLSGWTIKIEAGDILAYNVDSITTCERVLISLEVLRT